MRELKQRLVELGVAFQRNIDTWDEAILVDARGPRRACRTSYIESLTTEERDGQTLYRVSLDYPEMYPFLDNAESEPLRRELMIKNYLKGGPENVKRPRRGDRRARRAGADPGLRLLGRLRPRAAHGEGARRGRSRSSPTCASRVTPKLRQRHRRACARPSAPTPASPTPRWSSGTGASTTTT